VRELTELEREEEEAKSVAAVCKCYDDDNGEEEEEEENELITTCFESMQTAFFSGCRAPSRRTNKPMYIPWPAAGHGYTLGSDNMYVIVNAVQLY
jgi:hypothetical protein